MPTAFNTAIRVFSVGFPLGDKVSAVEHQNVVVAESVEVFEEHLALTDVERIELGSQSHLDPRQIEREANGVDDVANEWLAVRGFVEQGQAQDRGIAGNNAQPVPERIAELRTDQGEQMIVEKPEARSPKPEGRRPWPTPASGLGQRPARRLLAAGRRGSPEWRRTRPVQTALWTCIRRVGRPSGGED